MSTKMVRKESKFIRYMKGPVKVLARARDFYVRSLSGCAGHAAFGSAIGCPAPQFATLPRSFSANSSYSDYGSRDEDLRELIRIASTRSLTGKVEAELHRPKRSSPMAAGGVAAVPRSRTVAIGRIDEDRACEFGGDYYGEKSEAYPRSRSYAASRRTGML